MAEIIYRKGHLASLPTQKWPKWSFNMLVQWHGLPTDEQGFVPLSIAEFSL
jgi:hypothetical protein